MMMRALFTFALVCAFGCSAGNAAEDLGESEEAVRPPAGPPRTPPTAPVRDLDREAQEQVQRDLALQRTQQAAAAQAQSDRLAMLRGDWTVSDSVYETEFRHQHARFGRLRFHFNPATNGTHYVPEGNCYYNFRIDRTVISPNGWPAFTITNDRIRIGVVPAQYWDIRSLTQSRLVLDGAGGEVNGMTLVLTR